MGSGLFQRCQRVLAEVEDLQSEASGARAEPAGELRIDLPVYYGKRFIMPLLASLMARHPKLRLDIRLTDIQVDLVRDGIDLAVRIGQLRDSTLVARRIDQQGLVMCASRGYLDRTRHAAARRGFWRDTRPSFSGCRLRAGIGPGSCVSGARRSN